MRVIAGEARSLPLKCPEGLDTRPTTDRIKETLFNILQPWIPGSIFVDLCSGSGAIGIEAISRGAKRAYFVENAAKAVKCIQENLHFTKFEDRAVLLRQDVVAALSGIHEKEADVIFMDAPYSAGLEEPVLEALYRMPYVTEETLIVFEAERNRNFSFAEDCGFDVTREKCYKTNKHVFMKKRNAEH